MKWKLLTTMGFAGLIGIGIYFRREIASVVERTRDSIKLPGDLTQTPHTAYQPHLTTPDDFKQEAQRLHDYGIVFLQQHSREIVEGKYDAPINAVIKKAGKFFGALESTGQERMQRLYGELGHKVNQTLLQFRHEACQVEVRQLQLEIDQVLEKYLTPEQKEQQHLDLEQQLLQQHDLNYWLHRLSDQYHVQIKLQGG